VPPQEKPPPWISWEHLQGLAADIETVRVGQIMPRVATRCLRSDTPKAGHVVTAGTPSAPRDQRTRRLDVQTLIKLVPSRCVRRIHTEPTALVTLVDAT